MQDVVGAAAGAVEDFAIGDAADDQLDLVAHGGQILFAARGKIVEHGHLMAAAHQFVHGVRADESGAARYQVAHKVVLLT